MGRLLGVIAVAAAVAVGFPSAAVHAEERRAAVSTDVGDESGSTLDTVTETDAGFRGFAALAGGDPGRSQQWALDALDAEATWSQQTAEGVVVAVLDTGIDASHPDLLGVVPGFDAIGDTAGTIDPNGHGTGVAGVVGATVGNGVGIAGMAPRVSVMPVRVLAQDRTGSIADVEAGIRYATNHGADVLNLSFGSPFPSERIRAAIDDATLAGAVVVASAGNTFDTGNTPRYPAADSDVISVTAIGRDLRQAPFSTTHSSVDVAAPGVDILMTAPNASYVRDDGTSFAAPHISATAALVKARYPRATAAQVMERVIESARDLPPSGHDDVYGAGVVQPLAALSWQPDAGCQIVDFDPVMRVWDDDRVQTAAAAACTFWPERGVRRAVVATARTFPDALAGTPLAAALDAPLMLTHPDTAGVEVRQVLAQLGVQEVTVLGGDGAVSPQVDAALAGMGIDVRRIAGADRFDTAARAAAHTNSTSRRAIVVSGSGFADAVAAGAYAAADAPPVLLTARDRLPAATAAALTELQPEEILVIGGDAAVSDGVVDRLGAFASGRVRRVSGGDRYATSAAVLRDVGASGDAPLLLATGADFPDALAAGAVAARLGAGVLLVRPGHATAAADVIRTGPWSLAAVMGGTAAVSERDAATLRAALNGASP